MCFVKYTVSVNFDTKIRLDSSAQESRYITNAFRLQISVQKTNIFIKKYQFTTRNAPFVWIRILTPRLAHPSSSSPFSPARTLI